MVQKKVNIHAKGKLVFLNIGAADYLTTVLINGKCAGRHKGGYTSFKFNITDYIKDGENEIFILCEDEVRDPYVPAGKQSDRKTAMPAVIHAPRVFGEMFTLSLYLKTILKVLKYILTKSSAAVIFHSN